LIAHDLPGEGYIGDQGVARGGKIAAVGDVNIAWPQRKVADRRVGGLARLNRGDIEFEFAGGRWGLGDESQGERTQVRESVAAVSANVLDECAMSVF